jgi:cation diffusion facilitator family transporter
MAHDHKHGRLGRRLLIGLVINAGMLALQVVGGISANSLGLLSDAAHNGSDVAALGMAYAADRVRKRPGTDKLTYAYGRWEVLVALINAVALIAVSAVIVYAAVGRLLHPSPVNGPLVMAFALVSLVGNALAAWLLQGERSVNARSAFLHLAGDAAASGAVLVGGLLIWLAHLDRVDPVLSIAIAVWITRGAIKVIVEAGRILLEGVPVGLDLADVERAVLGVDGVAGVHDMHVWSVSSSDAVLSAHVQLADGQLSGATRVVDQIKGALATSFGVHHATLEVECVGRECADGCCVYAPAQIAQ